MTGRELIIFIMENKLEDVEFDIPENYLTVEETAAKYNVGVETVKAWIKFGYLNSVNLKGEQYIPENAEPSILHGGRDTEDIIFDNRWEAEKILTEMKRVIAKYGRVTIANLNVLIGRTYTSEDIKYGWTNLEGVSVTRSRLGYAITLPKTICVL